MHPAGLSASELYVVKTGEFEVLQRRKVRALGLRMRAGCGHVGSLARDAACGCGMFYGCLTVRTRPAECDARTCCLRLQLYHGVYPASACPQGVNIRVNMKRRGDVFGEVALMFNCPRSATVAATQNSVVWVLERDTFRQYVREVHETESSQLELFLNSGGWLGWARAQWQVTVPGGECMQACAGAAAVAAAGWEAAALAPGTAAAVAAFCCCSRCTHVY